MDEPFLFKHAAGSKVGRTHQVQMKHSLLTQGPRGLPCSFPLLPFFSPLPLSLINTQPCTTPYSNYKALTFSNRKKKRKGNGRETGPWITWPCPQMLSLTRQFILCQQKAVFEEWRYKGRSMLCASPQQRGERVHVTQGCQGNGPPLYCVNAGRASCGVREGGILLSLLAKAGGFAALVKDNRCA